MQDTPDEDKLTLDLLEELLSITEPAKDLLEADHRKRWQAISAECADRRVDSSIE